MFGAIWSYRAPKQWKIAPSVPPTVTEQVGGTRGPAPWPNFASALRPQPLGQKHNSLRKGWGNTLRRTCRRNIDICSPSRLGHTCGNTVCPVLRVFVRMDSHGRLLQFQTMEHCSQCSPTVSAQVGGTHGPAPWPNLASALRTQPLGQKSMQKTLFFQLFWPSAHQG